MLTLFAGTAFAEDPKEVNAVVSASFQKHFSFVKDVKWTVFDDYTKAEFLYAESRIEAYFSNDGEFLGSLRNILYGKLPLSVMSAVENRFGKTGAYDVIEHNAPGGTVYYMMIEQGKRKYQIKVDTGGFISVMKKSRK